VYDPYAEKFSKTGSLMTARSGPTVTTLSDGRVLVAGGANGTTFPSSAELYDPATGKFSLTGSLADGRFGHTATLLPDGSVLVAGGGGSLSAPGLVERYWPYERGSLSPAGG
jgi:hypothetical protein